MSNKAILELTSCADCPQCDKSERYYTADSWEHIMQWKCKLTGRIVHYHEWNDKDPAIPDDCPLLPENKIKEKGE